MFKIRLKQIRMVAWLAIFHFLKRFIKSNYWVICERGNEARDNGYCFYRYMKEKHPEQKVYFMITKDSADYEKVKGDAVIFNSIKSFWVITFARKIISAHYASVLLRNEGAKIFKLFRLYEKFYFLQHGVIKDDLKGLYADNTPMRLFVCGAKPEYEDVAKNYGHPEGVVRYTGLARFDYLHDFEVNDQILIMPTWRLAIKDEEEFVRSEYFVMWQKVLLDEELNKKLQEKDIKLYFYVHYEMQNYIKHFQVGSERVIIAKFDDYDVQTLLKDSAILVTDYSSVFFDFAYMRKPVLYYHFDEYHYEKGYFNYQSMGFGQVCTEHETLITSLNQMVDRGFQMEPLYQNRAESFFPLHDKNNCERIYHAILENE